MSNTNESNKTAKKETPVFENYIFGITIRPYSDRIAEPKRGHTYFEVIAQHDDDAYQSATFPTSQEAIDCAHKWESAYKPWNIKVVEHTRFTAEIEW